MKKEAEKNTTIEINAREVLREIINTDWTVQRSIINAVRERLIKDLVKDIKNDFFSENWNGKKEVKEYVLDELKDEQTELVKKILKEFYDNYRYKKTDLAILKELKKFIGED